MSLVYFKNALFCIYIFVYKNSNFGGFSKDKSMFNQKYHYFSWKRISNKKNSKTFLTIKVIFFASCFDEFFVVKSKWRDVYNPFRTVLMFRTVSPRASYSRLFEKPQYRSFVTSPSIISRKFSTQPSVEGIKKFSQEILARQIIGSRVMCHFLFSPLIIVIEILWHL